MYVGSIYRKQWLSNRFDIVGWYNSSVVSQFTDKPLSIDLFLDHHHIPTSKAKLICIFAYVVVQSLHSPIEIREQESDKEMKEEKEGGE